MTAVPGRSSASSRPEVAAPTDLPSAVRAGAWALGFCLASSLLLLFLASFAGATMEVVRIDGRRTVVSPSTVVVTVLLSVLVGTLLLAAVGRRSRRAWMSVAVVGLVFGLLSTAAPLTSRAEPLTTFVLVAMHVVCALVWFTVLTALLRRA